MSYLFTPYLYTPSTCTSTCTHMHLPHAPPHSPPQTPSTSTSADTSTCTSTDTFQMHPTHAPYTSTCLPAYRGRFAPKGGESCFLPSLLTKIGGALAGSGAVFLIRVFTCIIAIAKPWFFTTYPLKKVGKGSFTREVSKVTVVMCSFMW